MSNPSRGERFILDLSDDEDNSTTSQPSNQPTNPRLPHHHNPRLLPKRHHRARPLRPKTSLRTSLQTDPHWLPRAQEADTPPAVAAGRDGQDGQGGDKTTAGARGVVGGGAVDPEEEERRQIDLENQKRIAEMSTEEIEQERAELLAALDPALVAMLMKRGGGGVEKKKTLAQVSDAEMVHRMKGDLEGGKNGEGGKRREVGLEEYLKRANIDDGRGDTWVEEVPTPTPAVTATTAEAVTSGAAAADATSEADKEKEDAKDEDTKATKISKPKGRRIEPTKAVHWLENDEAEPKDIPDLQPASSFTPRGHTHSSQPTDSPQPTDPTTSSTQQGEPVNTLHFPRPPTLPDLDPSSPNFLTDLHTAYFPSLPSSPSSLAWLAPLPSPGSPADLESSYSPSQPSIPASSLRFDFKGQLLPPRISRAMPTDRGLHHHADAPEAGGYTIPELARLMRSSVPQQRGVAVQTLGRVLYRLGKGEWGMGGEMTMGLWRCVEEGGVVGVGEDGGG
ncbi:hypothetical protein ACLOAV_000312 [Pseudogymnoascus australis]